MLAHGTLFWWAPQSLGRKESVRVRALSSAKTVLMKPPPRRAAWHGCNTTLTFSVARDSTWDGTMIFAPCCFKFLLSLFWLHQSYFALTLGLIWRQPTHLSVLLLLSPTVTSKWTPVSSWERSSVQLSQTLTCAGAEQGLLKPPSMASQSQYFCQPWSIQLTLEDAILNPLTDLT